MGSLVVLCAVLVLAAAASHPSHLTKRSVQPVTYITPAVSHQSRFDVKTSQIVPASIAAEAVASLQARAVAPFNIPSSVSHEAVSPAAPVPLAVRAVYAGQVPTVFAGGSAVTHEIRYDTASGPYVLSDQVLPPAVQAQPVIASW